MAIDRYTLGRFCFNFSIRYVLGDHTWNGLKMVKVICIWIVANHFLNVNSLYFNNTSILEVKLIFRWFFLPLI